MFCNHCGSSLDENSRFCINCGNPVPTAPAEPPKPAASVFTPAQDLAENTFRPRPAAPKAPAKPAAPVVPVYSSPVRRTMPTPPPAAPVAPDPVKEDLPLWEAAVPNVPPVVPPQPEAQAVPACVTPVAPPEPERNPAPAYVPPVPPAPANRKKAGFPVGLVIVFLLIAALVGTAVWGFADGWLPELFSGTNAGDDRDDDDDDKDDDDDEADDGDDNPRPAEDDWNSDKDQNDGKEDELDAVDWEPVTVKGMTFYLDPTLDEVETESDYGFYANDDTEVIINSTDVDEWGDFTTSAEFAEYIAEEEYDGEVKMSKRNGISYFVVNDKEVYAFYVDGDRCWVFGCYSHNMDEHLDLAIQMATSGKLE